MREQFEAWCKSRRLDLQRNAADGTYYGLSANMLWEAWKASAKAEREGCAQACIAQQTEHGNELYNAGLKTAFSVIRMRNIQQGEG